jgi:formylglycine-generating enzyme required for sulfatase activity
VYLASDAAGNRVAIKRLSASGLSPGDTDRFHREIRILATLSSDPRVMNIVGYRGSGVEHGCPYLVMDFVPGGSVADRLKRGGVGAREACTIVAGAARGAGRAHEVTGGIHRDIKPANILLDGGVPKLADFGIWKLLPAAAAGTDPPTAARPLATPGYAAPEVRAGLADRIGPWSDVYSLGVVLYVLLTGHLPPAPHGLGDVYPITPPALPPRPSWDAAPGEAALRACLAKCLAHDPADRFGSAGELAAALEAVVTELPPLSDPAGPVRRRRHLAAVATALAAAAALSLTLVAGREGPVPGDEAPPAKGPAPAPLAGTATGGAPTPGAKGPEPVPRQLPELPATLAIRLSETETLEFVLVDPPNKADKGKFHMGSSQANLALIKAKGWVEPAGEAEREVTLTRAYYLGRTEVTKGQFEAFVAATGKATSAEKAIANKKAGGFGLDFSRPPFAERRTFTWREPGYRQDRSHPAVCLSWVDCQEFARWVSGTEDFQRQAAQLGGRAWEAGLPTEGQWEYACRAGSRTLFACGDDQNDLASRGADKGYGNVPDGAFRRLLGQPPDRRRAVEEEDGYLFTAPVGSYSPNNFGLYDMHGNAWEWTRDYYGPYGLLPTTDPVQGTRQENDVRVLRGGSWRYYVTGCRSAYRHKFAPDESWCDFGFRVCLRSET